MGRKKYFSWICPWKSVESQRSTFFPSSSHPYRLLDAEIEKRLCTGARILDIGCGKDAALLHKYAAHVESAIGVDPVVKQDIYGNIELYSAQIEDMHAIPDNSIDLGYSRSVMEHVQHPLSVLREIERVLVPSGRYIFLTPNFLDYGSLIAHCIPNKWHASIVSFCEGRQKSDVFPTVYACNTKKTIFALAEKAGLEVNFFSYAGQYPSYLQFNRILHWLGCVYEKCLESTPKLHFLRGWILCCVVKP